MSIARILPISLLCAILVSSCAQITNEITVNGEHNTITVTGVVDKTTDDLMDVAGSAYGDAQTQQGRKK